jgi:hypothetical protein
MLLLSLPNSMEGTHQIKPDDISNPGLILDSCEDLRRYRRKGTEEAHNVLEAIRHNIKLIDRIKVCLQGILQLQQKHLRTRFRHLSPEQKSTSAFLLKLQSHMAESKSSFLPTMYALQSPPRVSVEKRWSSGSRWRGVGIRCST